jgi:type I restriction enzyme S subunit
MTKIPKIKLGKIAKFQQGLQVDVDCQFYSREENYVQFLRIVDYTNNEEKPRFIEQIKDSPSFVNKNDVVMIRYGSQTAGKVVIGKEGIIANNMFRIIPTINEIEKRYLYYFLKNQTIYNFLMNGQSSSTMPAITFGMMYDVDILLPEIVVQQKIASILSALDSKIELNNRINAELEALAKTLYDYWFVQFDFPDKNGNPYKTSGGKMVWNEELKREIPEGWEVTELKNISKNLMGQSPKGESYNKEGIGMPLLNGPADYENGSLLGRTYTTKPTRVCQKDDMVLCIRATIGNLTFAEKEFCLGRGVAAVRPNKKKYSEYLFYCLIQEIERFKIQATGSIIVGITKDDLTGSLCILPQNDLIDKFHKIANPIFSKQRRNKVENLKLASLRDWLLPMLMNGQVSVGEVAKEYQMEEEVLGMVAEDKVEYKKS